MTRNVQTKGKERRQCLFPFEKYNFFQSFHQTSITLHLLICKGCWLSASSILFFFKSLWMLVTTLQRKGLLCPVNDPLFWRIIKINTGNLYSQTKSAPISNRMLGFRDIKSKVWMARNNSAPLYIIFQHCQKRTSAFCACTRVMARTTVSTHVTL